MIDMGASTILLVGSYLANALSGLIIADVAIYVL
jgi:hypothetical protein